MQFEQLHIQLILLQYNLSHHKLSRHFHLTHHQLVHRQLTHHLLHNLFDPQRLLLLLDSKDLGLRVTFRMFQHPPHRLLPRYRSHLHPKAKYILKLCEFG